jgi:hypothetical protein
VQARGILAPLLLYIFLRFARFNLQLFFFVVRPVRGSEWVGTVWATDLPWCRGTGASRIYFKDGGTGVHSQGELEFLAPAGFWAVGVNWSSLNRLTPEILGLHVCVSWM